MVWNYVKRCFNSQELGRRGQGSLLAEAFCCPLPIASTSPFHVTNWIFPWPPSRKTRKKASGSRELGSIFSSEDWMLANMASLKKWRHEQSDMWISDSLWNCGDKEQRFKNMGQPWLLHILQKVLELQREPSFSFSSPCFFFIQEILKPHFYGKCSTRHCPHDANRLVGKIESGYIFRNYEKLWEGITEKSYWA